MLRLNITAKWTSTSWQGLPPDSIDDANHFPFILSFEGPEERDGEGRKRSGLVNDFLPQLSAARGQQPQLPAPPYFSFSRLANLPLNQRSATFPQTGHAVEFIHCDFR